MTNSDGSQPSLRAAQAAFVNNDFVAKQLAALAVEVAHDRTRSNALAAAHPRLSPRADPI
jgi:hypothetical protein